MQRDLDVNPAYAAWKSSTGQEKALALNHLIDLMEKYAKAICWRRIPDHEREFNNLVNGIVWRATQHLDKFKGNSKFHTWFYRIAVNECNRYLRNAKELNETILEEEMPSKAEAIEAQIDVLAILDGLNGPDHTMFRMVAEGESLRSIGLALGIGRDAAKKRWLRLKEKIHAVSL